MTSITPSMIKELREKTGSGISDCKQALVEGQGDFEKAEDILRQKGILLAGKKSSNIAAEGLVGICVKDNKASIVEVNSETDFVSNNPDFIGFVKNVTLKSLDITSVEELEVSTLDNGQTVKDSLLGLVTKIRENLVLRKVKQLTASSGDIFSYMHSQTEKNIGKIAVAINLKGEGDLTTLGKHLCMHIAAFAPKGLDVNTLNSTDVEREKNVQKAIIKESNKPDNIQAQMLEGKMKKFYKETCLLEQNYLMDDKKSVKQVLKEHNAEILEYVRVALGEGIEKKSEDFAAEVQKTMGSSN